MISIAPRKMRKEGRTDASSAPRRADGGNDAGALFGACHLSSDGIVSIHAHGKQEDGKGGGKGEEEGKSEGRTHLELLVRGLDVQRHTAGWRSERKLMGCGWEEVGIEMK
jgi:hypothetical protein